MYPPHEACSAEASVKSMPASQVHYTNVKQPILTIDDAIKVPACPTVDSGLRILTLVPACMAIIPSAHRSARYRYRYRCYYQYHYQYRYQNQYQYQYHYYYHYPTSTATATTMSTTAATAITTTTAAPLHIVGQAKSYFVSPRVNPFEPDTWSHGDAESAMKAQP